MIYGKLEILATVLAFTVASCGGTVGTADDPDATTDTTPADTTTDEETDVGDDTIVDDTVTPDTSDDTVIVEDTVDDTIVVEDTVDDTSDPDVPMDIPTDSSCPTISIPFEAEAMTMDAGFRTRTSSRPYIGEFIETIDDDAGIASWTVDIPCTDTYVMWALVWWSDGAEDSFLYTWDTGGDVLQYDVMQQCGTSITADWYWDQVSWKWDTGGCGTPEEDPALMYLTAGSHTFYLMGREADTAVDEFILTNDLGYTPPDPG